ncbi:MAG: SRPBCC family protein [Calditrichaceae bacterium]
MSSNTVHLHRVIRAAPEKIYRAFIQADAIVKWFPPNGFTCKVHQFDAKVGGTYRMSFINLSNRQEHIFSGTYLKIVPNECISISDTFEEPGFPGEMITTASLKQVSGGTELNIVQEGIPESILLESCYLGWQESLNLLALLVEAEISE